MKRLCVAALAVFLSAAAGYAQSLPSIKIVNKTGYSIYYIYVSPSADDEWGEELLGDDILENGQTYTIRLPEPLNKVKVYDIGVEDEDGDVYFKWNVTLTNNAQITFTVDDMDAEAPEGSS